MSSTTGPQLGNCCDNGNQLLVATKGLQPLSEIAKHIYTDRVDHVSGSSNVYNSMLSLCAIGVDKGADREGGFEDRGAGEE